ncbi:lipocalin family protein [Pontibacter sp. MBLB2868]|uniref:lipocalin family protein n=1 Tax=Pontibacter sp. MBLB2868 TaxID=3451555 RepID=UPI003F754439
MNKKILLTQLLLLFTISILTSCGKKDDPELTKTDMLVAEVWKGDQVLVNGMDVSEREEVINEIGRIKTARMKFERDGTYHATYENNNGQQEENGTWEFNEDETKMTFDLYGEVNVVSLTDRNLDFMAKIPFQGAVFDAEVKFVK